MILKFNMTVINTIQNSLNKEQILSSDHRMVRKTWSHALNRRNGAHWVLSVLYRGGRNLIITFSNFITCTAFSFSILLKFHLHRKSFFLRMFWKVRVLISEIHITILHEGFVKFKYFLFHFSFKSFQRQVWGDRITMEVSISACSRDQQPTPPQPHTDAFQTWVLL